MLWFVNYYNDFLMVILSCLAFLCTLSFISQSEIIAFIRGERITLIIYVMSISYFSVLFRSRIGFEVFGEIGFVVGFSLLLKVLILFHCCNWYVWAFSFFLSDLDLMQAEKLSEKVNACGETLPQTCICQFWSSHGQR